MIGNSPQVLNFTSYFSNSTGSSVTHRRFSPSPGPSPLTWAFMEPTHPKMAVTANKAERLFMVLYITYGIYCHVAKGLD